MERTRREREHVFARVALPGRRARPERGIRPLPSECTPDGRQRSAVLKVCMDLYLFLSLCLSRYTSSTVGLIIDSALQDPFSLSVSSSAVGLAGVVCTLMAFLLWTVYSTTEHSSQSAFPCPLPSPRRHTRVSRLPDRSTVAAALFSVPGTTVLHVFVATLCSSLRTPPL